MNILERTKALNLEIKEIEKLRLRSSEAGKFEQLSNHLEPVKVMFAKLEKPLDSMTVIDDIQISNEFNTLVVLSAMLKDFKDRYEKDKNDALDPFPGKDSIHEFINPLRALAEKVDDNLNSAWEKWTKEITPSGINEETLNVLSGAGIKGVTELRRKVEEIQNLSQILPQDINTPGNLKGLCESVRDAWEELDAPPAVVSFLREAYGDNGASWTLFSDEVKKWLEEKGLISNVKIKM